MHCGWNPTGAQRVVCSGTPAPGNAPERTSPLPDGPTLIIEPNAPCPCGSRRTYGECCRDRRPRAGSPAGDTERAESESGLQGRPAPLENAPAFPSAQGADGTPGPGPEVVEAARNEPVWEVDIVRLPWTIHEDPEALPSLLAVMAGPYLLGTDVLRKPSGEPDEVAVLLNGALEESAHLLGSWPERVRVRQGEMAERLQPTLQERGVAVESSSYLVYLDQMARQLVRAHGAPEGKLVYSFPGTWASWGLPEPLVRELFQAAAELHEAAPWDALASERGLEGRLPDGRTWYLALLEPRRMPPGVSIYEDPDDLTAAGIASSPEEVARSIRGRFYTLLFGPGSELPEPMRQEIGDQGWNVADPDASPFLMAVNTPGGVIRESDGKDLVTLLRALAALGRHAHEDLEGQNIGEAWRDPSTGVRLGFMSAGTLVRGMEVAVERQNRSPRAELGGLSAAQVQRLLRADWMDRDGPLALAADLEAEEVRGSRVVDNARVLLTSALEEGAPATRNGNLGRAFVQRMLDALEWPEHGRSELLALPPKVVNEGDLPTLRSLRRLLEAAELLERKGPRFTVTDRGRALMETGREGELHAHLFEAHLRRMDLKELDAAGVGDELQESVPYALYRLRHAGHRWLTLDEAVDELLLPPVREAAERAGGPIGLKVAVEQRILAPLEGFGLMEAGPVSEEGSAFDVQYRITELYDRFLRFSPHQEE